MSMMSRCGSATSWSSGAVLSLVLAGCGEYQGPASTTPNVSTAGMASSAAGMTSSAAGMTSSGGSQTSTGAGGAAGEAPSVAGGGAGEMPGAAGGGAGETSGAAGMGGAPPVGPPPEAMCVDVTACGGDLVGTWNVTSSCLQVSELADLTGFGLNCTEAPVSGTLAVTGTLTVLADGTLTDETNTTGEEVMELSAECLNVSGTVTTCDRVGAPLASLGFTSVNCVDSASGGCTCTGAVDQTGGMAFVSFDAVEDGDYVSANNVLTVSDRVDVEYGYCVADGAVTLSLMSMSPTGPVTGQIVLQKQ